MAYSKCNVADIYTIDAHPLGSKGGGKTHSLGWLKVYV